MPRWNVEERLWKYRVAQMYSKWVSNVAKRPHICRFEGRGEFCQMKDFWGGQVRDKGSENEAENDALKSMYGKYDKHRQWKEMKLGY